MHFHLQLQNKYTIKFFFRFAIIIIRLNEQRKYLKHVKKNKKTIETIRNYQFICITVGINNKYVLSYRKWIHDNTETWTFVMIWVLIEDKVEKVKMFEKHFFFLKVKPQVQQRSSCFHVPLWDSWWEAVDGHSSSDNSTTTNRNYQRFNFNKSLITIHSNFSV